MVELAEPLTDLLELAGLQTVDAVRPADALTDQTR